MYMYTYIHTRTRRGRLNLLGNVFRKPLAHIFSEFTGIKKGPDGSYSGSGDVKYHLGASPRGRSRLFVLYKLQLEFFFSFKLQLDIISLCRLYQGHCS